MRFVGDLDARKVVKKIKRKVFGFTYETNAADWRVLSPFKFYFDDKLPNLYIQVDAGWESDLASVPGFFGFVIQKDGDFAQAAVMHDWSYKNRGNVVFSESQSGEDVKGNPIVVRELPLTRAEQDRAFYDAMGCLGTSKPIRVIMWRAVRRFGWMSYPKG